MKKIYLLILLFVSMYSYSQEFNYQAVARDNSGQLIVNQNIGVLVEIAEAISTGTIVFTETHNVTTNNYGVFNLPVGGGSNPSTVLTNIDWSSNPFWLNISLDTTGGTAYQLVGSSEIKAVPLAINALSGTAGSDGADGADGSDGADGTDGKGIASTIMNPNGTLTITFTDNTSFTTGVLTGADGSDGADGQDGFNGQDGVDGTNGQDGQQGADGNGIASTLYVESSGTLIINFTDGSPSFVTGDLRGADGTNGTNGQDGAQGPIGLTGPAGSDGADGADGSQGPIGLTGPAGADGTNGTNGQDGAQGPIGLTGPAGSDGADGADGSQGPIGLTGPAGADGTNGTNGQDGDQGPIGLTGPAGSDGSDGADGADGSQGPIGLTGPAGADGTNGTNGQDGVDGVDGVGIVSTVDNGNGTFTLNFSDSTSFTTADLTGAAGTNGSDGADGNGITSTMNNGDGTFTLTFDDSTAFTTANLTGPQGPVGPSGTNTNTNLTQSNTSGVISYVNENSQTQTARVVSANSNNSILVGTDGGAYQRFAVVDLYNSAASAVLTNNFVTIPLNTSRTNVGGFTATATGIAVPVTGVYEVSYSMSYLTTANNGNNNGNNNGARSSVQTVLANGNVEIAGTKSFTYHRNENNGESTGAKSIIIRLNAGAVVRVRAKRESGAASIRSIIGGCNLTVKLLN